MVLAENGRLLFGSFSTSQNKPLVSFGNKCGTLRQPCSHGLTEALNPKPLNFALNPNKTSWGEGEGRPHKARAKQKLLKPTNALFLVGGQPCVCCCVFVGKGWLSVLGCPGIQGLHVIIAEIHIDQNNMEIRTIAPCKAAFPLVRSFDLCFRHPDDDSIAIMWSSVA